MALAKECAATTSSNEIKAEKLLKDQALYYGLTKGDLMANTVRLRSIFLVITTEQVDDRAAAQ